MLLKKHLTAERVVALEARDKRSALEELVDVVASAAPEVSRADLSEAIWRREALMSTGIGHHLAVPHVRMPGLTKPVVAIGLSADGLGDYESLDTDPIHIVAMIAAPAGQHDVYIRLLARVVEVFKDPAIRQQVITSADTACVYDLLTGEAHE